jgi:hypothetical protein
MEYLLFGATDAEPDVERADLDRRLAELES